MTQYNSRNPIKQTSKNPLIMSGLNSNLIILDTIPTKSTSILDKRLETLQKAKKTTVKLSKRIRNISEPHRKLSERMENCQKFHSLATLKCGHGNVKSVASSFRCQSKLCSYCSSKRSGNIVKQLAQPLKQYVNDKELQPFFITLTFKNTETLPTTNELKKARINFFNSKFMRENGFHSSIGSMELKIGKNSKQWHLHYHFLILLSFPNFECNSNGKFPIEVNQRMSETWEKANGGKGFIVDGRKFQIGKEKSFSEIFKYITKLNEVDKWSDKQLIEFLNWSKNRKQFYNIGKTRNNPEFKQLIKDCNEDVEVKETLPKKCDKCSCDEYLVNNYKWDFINSQYILRSYFVGKVNENGFIGPTGPEIFVKPKILYH